MSINRIRAAACVLLLLSTSSLFGQGVTITSIEESGRITWTSPSLNISCRVERVHSAAGLEQQTWTTQQVDFVISPSNETVVSAPTNTGTLFCRLVLERPDPHFPDITTDQSLALLASRQADPIFVVLDVRTAGEYATRHIINAEHLDYYSATFADEVDLLDKNQVYLIHCASGYRSGLAHDIMLSRGFHEVYNMLGGFNAFQGVTGADAFLEP